MKNKFSPAIAAFFSLLSAILLAASLSAFAQAPTSAKPKQIKIDEARQLYEKGEFEKAYSPLKMLARNGSVEADFMLYKMYLDGKAVKQDKALALKYLRHSASVSYKRTPGKWGFADAQYALGKHYAAGDMVTKNAKNALSNFRLAARQGHREAMAELPAYFAGEKGVAKDNALGYEWASIAANTLSGAEKDSANAYVAKFKPTLSERKQQLINKKVRDWEPRRD
jgi:TPR repeat protein